MRVSKIRTTRWSHRQIRPFADDHEPVRERFCARFAMRMFELSSADRKVLVTRMSGALAVQ